MRGMCPGHVYAQVFDASRNWSPAFPWDSHVLHLLLHPIALRKVDQSAMPLYHKLFLKALANRLHVRACVLACVRACAFRPFVSFRPPFHPPTLPPAFHPITLRPASLIPDAAVAATP